MGHIPCFGQILSEGPNFKTSGTRIHSQEASLIIKLLLILVAGKLKCLEGAKQ